MFKLCVWRHSDDIVLKYLQLGWEPLFCFWHETVKVKVNGLFIYNTYLEIFIIMVIHSTLWLR